VNLKEFEENFGKMENVRELLEKILSGKIVAAGLQPFQNVVLSSSLHSDYINDVLNSDCRYFSERIAAG